MEADYQILPKRNGKSDDSFKKLPSMDFYTNYFTFSLKEKQSKLYQYSFSLDEIPADSNLYNRAIKNAAKILRERIGMVAHSKQMLWGTKKITTASTIEINDEQVKGEAMIKPIKDIDLRDLGN